MRTVGTSRVLECWPYAGACSSGSSTRARIRLERAAPMLETLGVARAHRSRFQCRPVTGLRTPSRSCAARSHGDARRPRRRCGVKSCFRRQPPHGDARTAGSLCYDGRVLDLPDASIAPGGVHGRLPPRAQPARGARRAVPGAQARVERCSRNRARRIRRSAVALEMRNFTSVERDIVMEVIEAEAQAVGFRDIQVAIYNPRPVFVDVANFDRSLHEGAQALPRHAAVPRQPPVVRSAQTGNLGRRQPPTLESARGHPRRVARESAGGRPAREPWRRALAPGRLGHGRGQLRSASPRCGRRPDRSRLPARRDLARRRSRARGSRRRRFDVRDLAPGSYRLEFDLVSERIAWFAENGNSTVTLPIEISQTFQTG